MPAQLIYSGAPKLLGEKPRSPGLHHSSILKSYCISQGYFKDTGPINSVLAEVGLAYEETVANRLLACQPVEIFSTHLSEFSTMRNLEIRIDGIFITLDLIHLNPYGPYSIKRTDISSVNGPGSDKFTYFEMQLMSECVAIHSLTGFLDVMFESGNYRGGDKYIRRIWQYEFTKEQLSSHWNVILTEAASRHGWTRNGKQRAQTERLGIADATQDNQIRP